MSEQKLMSLIASIGELDAAAMAAAEQHVNSLTKPPGSLGRLEGIAIQAAGITGELAADVSKRAVIVMAGDHGVCEEGVSAFPAEVTPQMVMNFLAGGAAVNVLARGAGADVFCVDMGVNADLEHAELITCKTRKGTANMAREAAMSRDDATAALLGGFDLAARLAADGYRMFATGDMGIGNTTASAALCAVLGGMTADEAVGLGTGINEERRLHKVEVVKRALSCNRPDAADPIDTLAKVGGLEIAGLAGVILGAAANRSIVVVDGFISSAAALVAVSLAPQAAAYMIGSHLSQEQGHAMLLRKLGLSPMIQLDMRLGEGTGAVLAFHFVDAAVAVMREMATFESAGVSRE
ncbi:nicotinate-nucleotide--dimethylbenzimidazole phosphoribosyltransferase [Paenibacillus sacheonensis]|uniref:Nicotinate-nucleotide--dimethylbenzimidazole phosphoribosyltransferase n=1 Tax=Paenibacillus sacheonensis TaxID=742054 RepID=A0A7X4YMS9_9BACL|nr:nicotinate-nucleotide--dimethylbenzimidazole phosphoribosyltransferase [Paenibacillus sacheonensis]MBM7564706.1 nicotinate-nucleotide--dimethylbenzimidazole phosphoribosyltransferase [Paenibacillus sacheonensis]NBC69262.1 nicotinate-nucleotide--dimethylbenzimidazole phosphoribosyltransferase [Paenibacillus sacheonensis]